MDTVRGNVVVRQNERLTSAIIIAQSLLTRASHLVLAAVTAPIIFVFFGVACSCAKKPFAACLMLSDGVSGESQGQYVQG